MVRALEHAADPAKSLAVERSLCVIDSEDQRLCMGDTRSLYSQRFGNEVPVPTALSPF